MTVRLSGTEQTMNVPPGETILEAAMHTRDDVPYACIGGACGTRKARLLHGTVHMDQNFALGQADLKSGYILTCQSHPTSRTAMIDYDA